MARIRVWVCLTLLLNLGGLHADCRMELVSGACPPYASCCHSCSVQGGCCTEPGRYFSGCFCWGTAGGPFCHEHSPHSHSPHSHSPHSHTPHGHTPHQHHPRAQNLRLEPTRPSLHLFSLLSLLTHVFGRGRSSSHATHTPTFAAATATPTTSATPAIATPAVATTTAASNIAPAAMRPEAHRPSLQ